MMEGDQLFPPQLCKQFPSLTCHPCKATALKTASLASYHQRLVALPQPAQNTNACVSAACNTESPSKAFPNSHLESRLHLLGRTLEHPGPETLKAPKVITDR